MFDRDDLGMKLMVKSVMPLSMGVWWYAAAYAIFLMLLPFLAKGLKALGREYHLALAATVLVIWIDQLHPRNGENQRRLPRIHLPVHSDFCL